MVVRKYSVPDADCIQEAKAVRLIYLDDKALFEAFDPVTFSPTFGANWEESLNKSTLQETAETRRDQQVQETLDVLEKMGEGRKMYVKIKYFVEKAFEKKPGIMHKFGLNDYDTAAQSQPLMVTFLYKMHTQCEDAEFKPALLAAGLTQPVIDAVAAVAKDLEIEEQEQDKFIKGSSSATDERIAQYNDSFWYWQQVARASKVIFYDNPTKQNEYELPHGSAGVSYVLEGKVTDGSNNNANLKDVVVAIVENNFATVTNAFGNYGFVAVPPGNYTLSFTLGGYQDKTVPITITQSGKVTQNASLVLAP